MKFRVGLFILAGLLTVGCGTNEQANSEVKTANSNSSSVNTSNASTTEKPSETKPSDNSDVTNSTEREKPAAGKGNVQGTVFFDGKPVPNIDVKLCENFTAVVDIDCGGKTFTAKTDNDGVFVIKNVEPKEYGGLMVKVFNTRDYIYAREGIMSPQKYTVEADKTIFADDTHLYKSDLKITAPKAGARVPAEGLTITWNEYPNAAYYQVDLTPDENGADKVSYSDEKIEGTSFTPDKTLSAEKYDILVTAYNSNDRKISDTGSPQSFVVTDGAAAPKAQ